MEAEAMWITRVGTRIAYILAMFGCAHTAAQPGPAATPTAGTPQHRTRGTMRELERTGADTFDAYVVALATSEDSVDAVTALLLVELVTHVERDPAADGPIVVGFAETRSPAARAIADAVAVGLRKHPEFRVSDRLALDAVSDEQHREYDGGFEDSSLASVGAFHGLSAIGRVTIVRTGERSTITVRITSMRTLLVLADARVTTDALLPENATVETLRLAFPAPQTIHPKAPPAECAKDPKSQECREAIRRRVILTVQEVRALLSSDSVDDEPSICARDPTLHGCQDSDAGDERVACVAPDGRTLPAICCKDPTLEACWQ